MTLAAASAEARRRATSRNRLRRLPSPARIATIAHRDTSAGRPPIPRARVSRAQPRPCLPRWRSTPAGCHRDASECVISARSRRKHRRALLRAASSRGTQAHQSRTRAPAIQEHLGWRYHALAWRTVMVSHPRAVGVVTCAEFGLSLRCPSGRGAEPGCPGYYRRCFVRPPDAGC